MSLTPAERRLLKRFRQAKDDILRRSEITNELGASGELAQPFEDALNEEARQILMSHSTTMARDNITGRDMFRKVKRELAKKKGIIL